MIFYLEQKTVDQRSQVILPKVTQKGRIYILIKV